MLFQIIIIDFKRKSKFALFVTFLSHKSENNNASISEHFLRPIQTHPPTHTHTHKDTDPYIII